MTEETAWWDDTYAAQDAPPWETGEPQPTLVAAAEHVHGRVVDVGCGLGTEARWLAEQGHDVVGVDFSTVAIERARERAAAGETFDGSIQFETADVLALPDAGLGPFETAVDCGLLHALDHDQRRPYTDSLAEVIAEGGRAVVVSFGAGAPTDWGPTPVTQAEFREAFADWDVVVCRESSFRIQQGDVPGTLGVAEQR